MTLADTLQAELEWVFAAHKAVGLDGVMCLYSDSTQDIWRADQEGLRIWFGKNDIAHAIAELLKHYRDGALPNTPLLLNPIIHTADDAHTPLGSGIAWSTSPTLGIAEMEVGSADRLSTLGALRSPLQRAENMQAGLKIIACAEAPLMPVETGGVQGCRELYELAHIQSELYYPYYMLSGIEYLTKNGSYTHPDFMALSPPDAAAIAAKQIPLQRIKDAVQCWHAYDNHHVLFRRFGIDVPGLEDNLKYYQLCGRDFELLDATGPAHVGEESEEFEFLVEGWIPKGAITLISATGGTGKSSLAHNLAVKASIDYAPGEQPQWLGADINLEKCKGICVYFSGEDGPAIVNTRGKVYDPAGRSKRLMFQRTDLGEGATLASFLKRLEKLPEVSLVVIDPARKYLTGDEEDAGVVSEFFEAIENFAIKRNTAMVVVHHLVKGARPTHSSEMLDLLRGSQVFIDRPRVVIGLYREGPYTIAGLSKNNIPPQLGMMRGERVFVRDPEHLELVPLPGEEGIRSDELSAEEVEQLMQEKGITATSDGAVDAVENKATSTEPAKIGEAQAPISAASKPEKTTPKIAAKPVMSRPALKRPAIRRARPAKPPRQKSHS